MTVAASQLPGAPSPFAVFRRRDFSLLWLAQLISTIGSSLADLAAGILVFRLTGSALSVGLMLMATALPSLVLGLVAGVFVDRFDRKRIMIISDLLRAGLVAMIPLVVSTFGIAGLYVVVLVNAGVGQFFDPAHESVVPDVAAEDELAAANSFLSISSFGSTAIGFAAAGLLATTASIEIAFYVDSLTFLVSAVLLLGVRVGPIVAEGVATVGNVVANLRDGIRHLTRTPVLRSALLTGIPVYASFGLWNVLLLPFAIVALGATEFEYGVQEALTSVGFVVGSLLMARYADRLPEGQWIVASVIGMGVVGVAYGLVDSIALAFVLVSISGFLNAPASIARRLVMQRNTPREVCGRVFAAFFVARDVVFLIGMALAGLADVVDIRLLVIACSIVLIASGIWTQFAPGLGRPAAEWRRSLELLRASGAGPAGAARRATTADVELLARLVPQIAALDARRLANLAAPSRVIEAGTGTTLLREGDLGDAAFFVLSGRAVAGVPTSDGGYRSLSAMGPGDVFGEIGALTGSRRTANVVADEATTVLELPAATLRSIMDVPAVSALVLGKLTERLGRSTTADLPRLAGVDQGDLRELRQAPATSSAVELPKTYS
jgi:CRP-like cAMP-binding protein/sugar phosphate permease